MHATLCSILSDAVEGGFLSHNPAWRTYRYAGRKCEKKIADEETAQKIIAALEGESIKYETYFKLIIATGMRRGECCGLKWCDIDWEQRSIHICRNAVKVTDEEIFVKEPKTRAGNRYSKDSLCGVYFPQRESDFSAYLICPSPPISAVISSMRSNGNGGSQRGFIAMLMSFMGLSSAATRLELSAPHRLQR